MFFFTVKSNVADTSEEEEETLPLEAPEDHETIPESDKVTEQEESLSEEEIDDNQQGSVSDEEGEHCSESDADL